MASNIKYDLEDFSKIVTVAISSGEDERKVRVSAALLSAQSFYFKSACAESWVGTDQILNFPDEKPETFEIFMAWLNVGDIKHANSLQKIEPNDDNQTRAQKLSKRWSQLINCYIMADYIQAPKYTNIIMDALIEAVKDFDVLHSYEQFSPMCNSCVETINLVWDKTVVKSPLRKLVLDTLGSSRYPISSMTHNYFFDITSPGGQNLTVPQEFILEFLQLSLYQLEEHAEGRRPWIQSGNFYHVEEKLP
ncbi:hypothetical protein NHQ30_002588 [Ciborinia camelliae]|nr:hypothetical protein NHQ30_002588 [Ciborinia camelliae]